MLEFLKTVICPYCFHKFTKNKIMYRCNQNECKKSDKLEVDTIYAEYHNILSESEKRLPHIIVKPKPNREGFAKCDKCQQYTNMMICPKCHSTLPSTLDTMIVSVIGAPGAGKSYYIGALLKQLHTNINAYQCAFKFTTQEAAGIYNTRFESKFEKHTAIDKTNPPGENVNIVGANLPILCDIVDRKNNAVTFTFFDAAGENFNDMSVMAYVAPYISHSAAMILLLDPTEIPFVSHNLGIENEQGRCTYEDILNNIADVVHNQTLTKAESVIDIPLAIGFSKWDLIENSSLCPDGSCVVRQSTHFVNGFSQADADNVSNEIEGLLAAWHQENFISLARRKFKNVKFFGFSAIGANVENSGWVPSITPKRVEDPFLWLLNKKKMNTLIKKAPN